MEIETPTLKKIKGPGRPQLPPSEKRIVTTITLLPMHLELAKSRGWRVSDLVVDGIQHRLKCPESMQEYKDEIAHLSMAVSKLQRKLTEFSEKNGGGD